MNEINTLSQAHVIDISSGVKRGQDVMLTTHLHLVPRLRMSYTSSHPMRLHGM
jgi:hypothetical protein